jgi:hypothetical protein
MVIVAGLRPAVGASARAGIPAAFVFPRLDPCAVLEQQQADHAAVRHLHVLFAHGALGSARIECAWFGFANHVLCPFAFLFVRVVGTSSQVDKPAVGGLSNRNLKTLS